jgi:hypothetical protein
MAGVAREILDIGQAKTTQLFRERTRLYIYRIFELFRGNDIPQLLISATERTMLGPMILFMPAAMRQLAAAPQT